MIRFLILVIFLSFNYVNAQNLQGKITFTEKTARIEAFRDLSRKIPKEIFKDYLKDKYHKENIESLKNQKYEIETEPKRNINPFYLWNQLALYSVEYEDDYSKKFYYNSLGHLKKYEINDFSGTYPYRAIAYNTKGEVINITLVVSEVESFNFDKNEKLIGHWIENQYYNKNEKESLKRIVE
jgi:hypothetical protein